jgi:hypothetical protein
VIVRASGFHLALPKHVESKRDELMREATESLASGIIKLAESFPQLKKRAPHNASVLEYDFNYEPHHISIPLWGYLNPKRLGQDRENLPQEAYGFVISLGPKRLGCMEQMKSNIVYPKLELWGYMHVWAKDPELNAAMLQLKNTSLKGLDDFEKSLESDGDR